MWTKTCVWTCGVAITLLGASGCVGIPFAGKGVAADGPDMKHAGGPIQPGVVKPGPGGAPAGWQGPAPTPGGAGPYGPGAGMGPGGFPGSQSEQAAFFSQRMADIEDERKVLAIRITQLDSQLREKDRALVQASFELQEATSQIARTREDIDRWKGEMEKVRTKLRSVEKDSKVTLETLIHSLEQFLDRNPEARRPVNIEELIVPRK